MAGIVEKFRQSTSFKMGPGKAVSVYDGRKWPVVKCGAVYVTDEERTKSVTKHVISLSSSPDEKKKQKTSKYTVAIGSSFGHIHTFLKESDNVLKSYENTKAEDKCLLLIKKPKSASKQSIFSLKMLKAHSWADVSVGDMHIRNPDGTFKQDPYKTFKDRFKKKSDLSLPPDEWNSLPNQKTPFKGPTANQNSSYNGSPSNQNASFSVLSSVDEVREDNKSDIIVPKKSEKPVNIHNSYPFIKRGNNRKSQSLADLTEAGKEINNNKNMGGALSLVQGHQRPKVAPPGPPPPKPQRTHAADKTLIGTDNRPSHEGVNKGPHGNKPDVVCNVSVGNKPVNKSNYVRDRRTGSDPHMRVKHDSGFHSEGRLSSDELYDNGFKQDLSQCVRNGKQMTSSPIAVETTPLNNPQPAQRNYSNLRPQPQVPSYGYSQNQSNMPVNQPSVQRTGSDTNLRQKYSDPRQGQNNSFEQGQGHSSMTPSAQTYNKPVLQKKQSPESMGQIKHNVPVSQSQGYRHPEQNRTPNMKKNSPVQHPNSAPVGDSRSRSGVLQKRSNEFKSRKSLDNVTEGQMLNTSKQDTVSKAQSLGDLSVGCTFSLVGQKKLDSPNNLPSSEFTGTQLMKHIRNYREMTQNGNSDSIPFKARTRTLDDMESQNYHGRQEDVRASNSGNKLRHYGSLQHLPMSYDTYNSSQSTPNNPKPLTYREKTPMKPRRLPQTPGDVHEKKRQITDMMRSRMSVDSTSTSPSSASSHRGASTEPRPGGISATPSMSDREVSDLFHGERNEKVRKNSGMPNLCNNSDNKNNVPHIPPTYNETVNMNGSLHKSSSFGLHDQGGHVHSSGGRLSESGQTTLTSQSTIDSGYITNDPDPDTGTLSTSSYAKTLKQSAQSLYVSNKLYHHTKTDSHQSQNSYSKPPENYVEFNGVSSHHKGDHSKGVSPYTKGEHSQPTISNIKGGNSNAIVSGNYANVRHNKDTHTRTWLENHPGTFVNEPPTRQKSVEDKTDKNNNRHPNIPEDRVSDLTQSLPHERLAYVKQPLSHHKSEVSAKEIERLNHGSGGAGSFSCKSKGKSVSMSQGLNMIGRENSELEHSGSFLSKSHTKFTGSLKDLIGTDKQIIPIETLRLESANSTQTLPGSWKFSNRTRSESSLKFLGKPSVFQLLQNYNLYAVRLRIPDNFVIMDNMRVIECEVVLSTPWLYGKDATSPMSPKGSYAKLGGPNSAFRPVAVGGASPIKSVSMITVMEVSNQLTDMIESGQLQKGDLLIEVNEMLMMGEDLPTLSSALQNSQGELLFTVARDKARDNVLDRKRNSSSPTDEDFRRMEQKLTELTTELRKKDRTLKQLSALLPWKLPKGTNSVELKDQDGYMCNLSEDEFIV